MEDFCQYKLFKKPQPNLFIPPPYARKSESKGLHRKTPTLQLKASDPSKLLLLIESLQNRSSRDIEIKINKYLLQELQCSAVFTLTLLCVPNEAIIRVINDCILQVDIHMPANDHLILEILGSRDGVQFKLESLSSALIQVIRSIVPHLRGEVYSFPIFEMINKTGISERTDKPAILVFIVNTPHQKAFTSHMVHETLRFCLPLFIDLMMYEEEVRVSEECAALLNTCRLLFETLANYDELIQVIALEAKKITDSERCFIYMIDEYHKEMDVLIYDGDNKNRPNSVPKNTGVVGSVFISGKILKILNPSTHPLIIKSEEDSLGYERRNLLCFPITTIPDDTGNGNLGVIVVCNKQIGEYNVFDCDAVKALGLYCGLAVKQALSYKNTHEDLRRNKVSTEILRNHLDLKECDIKHIMYAQRPPYPGLSDVRFNAREVSMHHTTLLILKMFEDLNLISTFAIDRKALCKFILFIEMGYGNQPFHNWMHIFAVTQFAYSAICSFDMIKRKILTELEVLAILIACLCHNLSSTGANGIHLLGQCTTLNKMFFSDGNIREWYHLTQTFTILNTTGCNFLSHLDEKHYARCLEMIRSNILATNIATYLKYLVKQEIILTKMFKPHIPEHKHLFLSLFMICSKLCDQTKGWKTARLVAGQMYNEYFKQTDLDRAMKREQTPTMDREKSMIPDLQMDFLRDTCLPAFKIFTGIFPKAQFCIDSIMYSLKCWEVSRKYFIFRDLTETTSMEILTSKVLSFTESQLYTVEEEEGQEEQSYY